MKDYKDGKHVEITSYCVNFYSHPDGGYSFPCDKNGKIFLDEMTQKAIENYEMCMSRGPEHFPYAFNKIECLKQRWREPATGICNCGNRIELHNEYYGACECPHCGQWWNLFGQELKHPDRWNDYGEMDY